MVAEQNLALAINGREHQLRDRLVPFTADRSPSDGNGDRSGVESVAVVGLGYVGLPTAIAVHSRWSSVVGVDIDGARLRAIARGAVDLAEDDKRRLESGLSAGTFRLTCDSAVLHGADAVIVCVPTPVDQHHEPDVTALRRACSTVVAKAHSGQTIILSSTTFVGTTRELLVDPLEQRGFTVGTDIHVAYSPERIDPGNPDHLHRTTPRIVGGVTAECSDRAARIVGHMTDSVYLLSSPEAAELTKLYENVFRAVNLALANEFADVCGTLGLDPIEVTIAAGTKPYGFLGSFPGPGVGGHCIPCDPYYLLWQLHQRHRAAPLIEQAMRAIEVRPARVVERAVEVLAQAGRSPAGARVLVVGASYKAGVSDLRQSSALPIMAGLARLGVDVHYYDPLVSDLRLPNGDSSKTWLRSEIAPAGADWDLALIHTVHPGFDYGWARDCPLVLDATYQFDTARHREVV